MVDQKEMTKEERNRLAKAKVVSNEIKEWEERVYYGELKFKEENTNETSPFYQSIDKIATDILDDSFRVIACQYEVQAYKIPRLMIEHMGFMNEDFTFDTGINLYSFIGEWGGKIWTLQDRVNEYIQKNKYAFKNRIVIIPLIEFDIEIPIALYFINQLEACGAKGLIFSYEGNVSTSLMHRLVLGEYGKMLQFPKPTMQAKPKAIKDDGL